MVWRGWLGWHGVERMVGVAWCGKDGWGGMVWSGFIRLTIGAVTGYRQYGNES